MFHGIALAPGVDMYLDRQGVDTSTLAGNGLFQMLGVTSDALIAAAQMIDRMRDLGDNKGPSCGGASSARRSGDPDHRRYFPPIRLFGDDRTASNHHLAVERRGDLARAGTEPIGNDSGASKSRCVHPVSRLRVISRLFAFVRVRFGFVLFSPRSQKTAEILRVFDGAGEGIRTLDPDLGKVVLYP